MTVKSRGALKQTTYHFGLMDANGNKISSQARTSTAQFGFSEYVSSVYDGSFMAGSLRLNGAIIYKISSVARGGYGAIHRYLPTPCSRQYIEGDFLPVNVLTQPTWHAGLAAISATKSSAKLNDASADVGLIIAEIGETLRMLRHPFEGIIRATKTFSSLGGKIGGAASSGYLQYIFGILPSLRDAEDVLKTLAEKAASANDVLKSRRATETLEQSSATTTEQLVVGTSLMCPVQTSTTTKWTSTTIWYYRLLMELEALAKLGRWGLSPSQIPALMWEVTPFSFVVDWVVNVGDFLRAISPLFHLDVMGGCTSQVIETTHHSETLNAYACHANVPYKWPLDEFVPSCQTVRIRRLERKINTRPVPVLALQPNALSLQRIITSLALLVNTAGKSLRALPRK